jgi:hypothetical protein
MSNAVQKCGIDDPPPGGGILLPNDFLEIPFKRFLKDKGAAELVAPLEERLVALRGMAVSVSEQVRAENDRVGTGLLTMRYNPNAKEGRWRVRQAMFSLFEAQMHDLSIDRYSHFSPFDVDWSHHSLFDSLLRAASPQLHRFYRAADFAMLEIESRIDCCRKLIAALDRVETALERKSKMSIKERELAELIIGEAAREGAR